VAVAQITVRLEPTVKTAFESYAAEYGLDASELAKLLIVRERYRKQLLKMSAAAELPERLRRPAGGRLPTITAHLSTVRDVEQFDAYAERCGLNRTGAGALLFEAELNERWLEKALRAS
jgi:hypothetical protein